MPTPQPIIKIDPGLFEPEELQTRLEKARRSGDCTPNGIFFRWWLEGPSGAGFTLYRRPWHSDVEIEHASLHLFHARDVVEMSEVAVP